jgi:hypothetical protein
MELLQVKFLRIKPASYGSDYHNMRAKETPKFSSGWLDRFKKRFKIK